MTRKIGRPSKYTEALAAEICERLSKGETLQSICTDEHMPAVRTVSDWKDERDGFSASFARARDEGFDAIAADCIEIAENGANDYMERKYGEDEASSWVLNGEHVQRSKLRIETRLKLLAKWDPKRYGDRQAIEHSMSVPEELASWLNNRS